MRRFHYLTLLFTFAASLLTAATGSADPVRITSGIISVSGAQDVMSRGFLRSISFDFVLEDGERLAGGESDGSIQNPLFPYLGRVGFWTPPAQSPIFIFLDYSSFAVTASPSLVPTPFSLSGRLRVINGETLAPLFDETVFGAGTASWTFVMPPDGGRVVSGVRYEFADVAPTPEPATLLLLGTGLATLAARRRRKRPSQP